MSQVLKKALKKKNLSNQNYNQFISSIDDVGSDYYASSLYKKLAKKKLSEDQLIKVLNSLGNINSSNYLSSSLVAFAPSVKNSSQRVKDAYMKRAKSINSDTYFGRAMKAIY